MKAKYKFKTVPYHWVIINKIGDLDTKCYVSKEIFNHIINEYEHLFVFEEPIVDEVFGVYAIEEWYFTVDNIAVGYIYKEVHKQNGTTK